MNTRENVFSGKHLYALAVPTGFLKQPPKLPAAKTQRLSFSGTHCSLVCLCAQACLSSSPILLSVSYQ